MEEKIDMNLYPNRHGTKINIGFTYNNKSIGLLLLLLLLSDLVLTTG